MCCVRRGVRPPLSKRRRSRRDTVAAGDSCSLAHTPRLSSTRTSGKPPGSEHRLHRSLVFRLVYSIGLCALVPETTTVLPRIFESREQRRGCRARLTVSGGWYRGGCPSRAFAVIRFICLYVPLFALDVRVGKYPLEHRFIVTSGE